MKIPTSKEIKVMRLRFGITQKQLAVLMNVHEVTVESWEQSINIPCDMSKKILRILIDKKHGAKLFKILNLF